MSLINSVILRPKAEESLANARNVRGSGTGSEMVSGTSPEILRFAQDDIIHQRSFVANVPQDDKKGDCHVATLLAMTVNCQF